jgi:hypothetical protein
MGRSLCQEDGLAFIIVVGPRQRSHPRVRVPRDLIQNKWLPVEFQRGFTWHHVPVNSNLHNHRRESNKSHITKNDTHSFDYQQNQILQRTWTSDYNNNRMRNEFGLQRRATGWTVWVRVPAMQDFFSSPHRPGRLWGPPRGALSPGVKRHGREANHSSTCSTEVKKGGAISPLLLMSSWHRTNLTTLPLKYRL